MPYTPPFPKASLATLTDVELVAPSLSEVLSYGTSFAGKWSDEALPPGMTLNGLSGAVLLEGGPGVVVNTSGQDIILTGSSAGAREVTAFVPGVLKAARVARLIIPNVFLKQIDAYFYTAAPAGTSAAACANVVVSGLSGGLISMSMATAGVSEFHSPVLGANVYSQTDNASPGDVGQTLGGNIAYYGWLFTPTAPLTVAALAMDLQASGAPYVPGNWLRVGLIPAPVVGNATPVNLAALNALFVLDQQGQPAFFDIPVSNLPANDGSNFFPQVSNYAFNNPVNLANGTGYAIIVAVLNPGRTAVFNSNGFFSSTGVYTHGGAEDANSFSGNATWNNYLYGSGASGLWVHYGPGGHNFYPYFYLAGGTGGVAMDGTLDISISLTGAPATPGTDLNIGLLL